MEEVTEQQVTTAPRIVVPEVNIIIQEDEYEQPQASAETENKSWKQGANDKIYYIGPKSRLWEYRS